MNTNRISTNVWNILACTQCGHQLRQTPQGAACDRCSSTFECTDVGSLDLRLKKPKKYQLEFEIGPQSIPANGFSFEPLRMNPSPQVDYAREEVPYHLTREMMSYFPRARSQSSMVLDLGCGDAIHKSTCEHAGFEWVGLDVNPKLRALITGDAHALPFKDNAFEFVLSVAVLQLIRYPFTVMQEAYRVLKPGGTFVGTVAFLEPFHGSYYHYTHLGILGMLQYAGFAVDKVAPSKQWSVLVAQGEMLFPRMPEVMARSVVFPVEMLHKLWWRAGSLLSNKADENVRIRNTTGALTFIATKGGT